MGYAGSMDLDCHHAPIVPCELALEHNRRTEEEVLHDCGGAVAGHGDDGLLGGGDGDLTLGEDVQCAWAVLHWHHSKD